MAEEEPTSLEEYLEGRDRNVMDLERELVSSSGHKEVANALYVLGEADIPVDIDSQSGKFPMEAYFVGPYEDGHLWRLTPTGGEESCLDYTILQFSTHLLYKFKIGADGADRILF